MSPPHRGADRNPRAQRASSANMRVAPSQGRGSKRCGRHHVGHDRTSPPHRGADRTPPEEGHGRPTYGRPLTGARIETGKELTTGICRIVAPSQGRGSKPQSSASVHFPLQVAPSQGRGSKLRVNPSLYARNPSPPHRGADRNASGLPWGWIAAGRPLTGARIETGDRTMPD